jgi:hypothetical protein
MQERDKEPSVTIKGENILTGSQDVSLPICSMTLFSTFKHYKSAQFLFYRRASVFFANCAAWAQQIRSCYFDCTFGTLEREFTLNVRLVSCVV